jgi:hypothetical protein
MNSKTKKLTAYSASAVSFLLLGENVDGQIIYSNPDPDLQFYGTSDYSLDFNNDSIADIRFGIEFTTDFTSSISTAGFYVSRIERFYIDGFDAVVSNPVLPEDFGILNLELGEIIIADNIWNTADELNFGIFSTNFGEFSYNYAEWFNENNILGVRFLIDGNYHYGWVRLSIDNYSPIPNSGLPYLIIQDYAYEATPLTPITINEISASICSKINLIDKGEFNIPSDLQISFNKAADETKVSAYRIYLIHGVVPEDTILTTEYLESMPASRYLEISPTGEDVVVNLPLSLQDNNGEPIELNTNYFALILSIADGISTIENNVALRSNIEKFKIRSAAYIENVYLTEPSGNCGTSYFEGKFEAETRLYETSEFRAYLVTNGETPEEILLNLNTNFYYSIEPHDEVLYNFTFSDDMNIHIGGLKLFEKYFLMVVSIPDSISTSYTSTATSFSEADEGPILGYTEYYCEENDFKVNVYDIGSTNTVTDLNIQFENYTEAVDIDEYRIMVVKSENSESFSFDQTLDLPENKYFVIPFYNGNYDISLLNNLTDVDGDTIIPDRGYKVFANIVGENGKISLSKASEEIIINEPEIPEPIDQIFVAANQLNILSTKADLNLDLYNIMGEKLATYQIEPGTSQIDLNHLPKGIYLIRSQNKINFPVLKFYIGHSGY